MAELSLLEIKVVPYSTVSTFEAAVPTAEEVKAALESPCPPFLPPGPYFLTGKLAEPSAAPTIISFRQLQSTLATLDLAWSSLHWTKLKSLLHKNHTSGKFVVFAFGAFIMLHGIANLIPRSHSLAQRWLRTLNKLAPLALTAVEDALGKPTKELAGFQENVVKQTLHLAADAFSFVEGSFDLALARNVELLRTTVADEERHADLVADPAQREEQYRLAITRLRVDFMDLRIAAKYWIFRDGNCKNLVAVHEYYQSTVREITRKMECPGRPLRARYVPDRHAEFAKVYFPTRVDWSPWLFEALRNL